MLVIFKVIDQKLDDLEFVCLVFFFKPSPNISLHTQVKYMKVMLTITLFIVIEVSTTVISALVHAK